MKESISTIVKKNKANEYGLADYENITYNLGFLKLGYSLLKGLTPINALIFSRLEYEEQYALAHKYVDEDNFFIFDAEEISKHINIRDEIITNACKNLIKRKLIDYKFNDEFDLIKINKRNVMEFILNLEDKNGHNMTYIKGPDNRLARLQKQILKIDETTQSIQNNETNDKDLENLNTQDTKGEIIENA